MENGQNQEILGFIDDLIKQAGLDQVPEDFKVRYRDQLAAEAQKRLGLEMMKHLDAAGLDEFAALTEENAKPAAMQVFLAKAVPNYAALAQEAMKAFAGEFLAGAEKLRTALNK
ncbi:MAG: DUF5663 domain-containing protein [Patescibacteria group bacterium]|jgi:hypothetical protein